MSHKATHWLDDLDRFIGKVFAAWRRPISLALKTHVPFEDLGVASRADLLSAMELQNGPSIFFKACRTYEVKTLSVICEVLWRISNSSGFGFVEHVARKLGSRILLSSLRLQRLRQLELQLSVRELRVCYLKNQIGKKGFQLAISSRLRRLEKSLEPLSDCNCGICSLEASTCELESLFQNVRVHDGTLFDCETKLPYPTEAVYPSQGRLSNEP